MIYEEKQQFNINTIFLKEEVSFYKPLSFTTLFA